jgi:outer membrane lipoprotein carrier protein
MTKKNLNPVAAIQSLISGGLLRYYRIDFMSRQLASRCLIKKKLLMTPTVFSIIGVILFVIFVSAGSLAAETPPINDTVRKLQQIYEKTRDFRAYFIQETTVKSIGKTELEEGMVYFKNPRQMFWDYKKPKAKKLVMNAQKAWLYLPQENAVYTQDPEIIFKSEALIKFLSGLGKLKEDFRIQYHPSGAMDENGNYILLLYPREKGASYQYLQMTVAKNNFHILRVSFDDMMGNSTVLRFSGITMNTGLPSSLFQFQPPSGVSIFKMP